MSVGQQHHKIIKTYSGDTFSSSQPASSVVDSSVKVGVEVMMALGRGSDCCSFAASSTGRMILMGPLRQIDSKFLSSSTGAGSMTASILLAIRSACTQSPVGRVALVASIRTAILFDEQLRNVSMRWKDIWLQMARYELLETVLLMRKQQSDEMKIVWDDDVTAARLLGQIEFAGVMHLHLDVVRTQHKDRSLCVV